MESLMEFLPLIIAVLAIFIVIRFAVKAVVRLGFIAVIIIIAGLYFTGNLQLPL